MNINVITKNYQERQVDMKERVKELENELKIEIMDRQEAEELLQTAYDKIKKLEGDVRKLKAELGKVKKLKEEVSES